MFEIRNDNTYLDGKPFRLYTGAIHYFRIHPTDWERRLTLMRDFGLNAASVYVPWNMHERHRGEFNFKDHLDLAAFLECAAKVGLRCLYAPPHTYAPSAIWAVCPHFVSAIEISSFAPAIRDIFPRWKDGTTCFARC